MRLLPRRPARHALASALALALGSPLLAYAQDVAQDPQTPAEAQADPTEPAQAAAGSAKTLDNVVVTGSRIKRSEVEGPAPVNVITGEQIRKEGFSTVYEALSSLSEVTGTVQNDYDWGQSSINASPLNLRNLGPGRSLLLINGHRVSDYPLPYTGKSNFANYNNIPTGIVERIEVLSGGASAIYGSDAVAGVVNIILKKDMEGDVFRAKVGGADGGGRAMRDFSWSGGKGGEDWNVTYTMQYFKRDPLWASQRPFMDSEYDAPRRNWGYGGIREGVATNTPSTGIRLYDVDNDTRIRPPDGACESHDDEFFLQHRVIYDDFSGAATDTGYQCGQRAVFGHWTLKNGSEDFSFYLYGTKRFGDVEAWATYGYWDSTGESNTFMPAWAPGEDYIDPRQAAGHQRLSLLRYLSPSEIGGLDNALTKSHEVNFDFNAGLRGTIADRFDWEVSIGHAEYKLEERFPTIWEDRAAEYFLGPSLGTDPTTGLSIRTPDYDRLWYPISPEDYRQFRALGTKKARTWIDQASAVFSGDLFEGWAGPIGFAATLEAAKQGYQLTPDPNTLGTTPAYYTPFGNIETGGGERNRYAAGVEFKVPLLENLVFSAAGRYDKYDAVADDAATTWNAGLEYRPFSNLLLRATYATSFRAPDMHFVYADPSESIADQTDVLACVTDPNRQTPTTCPGGDGDPYHIDNPTIARQGTQDLLYETGDSLTYGFVWDAFEGFSLGADYWRININDAIDDVGPEQVLLDEAYCLTGKTPDGQPRDNPPSQALCDLQLSRVTRDANGMVTRVEIGPINRAKQSVSGVDVVSKYFLPTRFGDFSFALNYTKQLSYKVAQFDGDPFENTIDRDRQMRYRGRASATWSKDPWTVTVFTDWIAGRRSDRYNGCTALSTGYRPDPGNDCVDMREGSITEGEQSEVVRYYNQDQVYWNLSVGYDVSEAMRLNFYANNVFDKHYQDKWCGGFAYCVADPVGRELAAEFVYKFD